MKRYSIVRVEQQCPFIHEKQDKRAFINRCLKANQNYQCKDCYGDTKEQLIKKVAQALKKSLREGFTKGYTEIATDVVEFLGVE